MRADDEYKKHEKWIPVFTGMTGKNLITLCGLSVLCGENMAKGKDILTTGEVAKICNVASRTVGKWFDAGLLKGWRLPLSGDRRVKLSELIRFMKEHNIPYEEDDKL